ncbi:MAG: Ig domain-containing protein [Patescibacteria group bacterium]|jgi:hypothetical protein
MLSNDTKPKRDNVTRCFFIVDRKPNSLLLYAVTVVMIGFVFILTNRPTPAKADTTPVIDYAPSAIQNGQIVTINGTGFGVKSPVEPLRYDDFQDGTIGQRINDQASGGWFTQAFVHYPYYSTESQRVMGDVVATQHYDVTDYNQNIGLQEINPPYKHMYTSMYIHRDDISGDAKYSTNVKLWSRFEADAGDYIYLPQARCESQPSNGQGLMVGYDRNQIASCSTWYDMSPWWENEFSGWVRSERYIDAGTINGNDWVQWFREDLQTVSETGPGCGSLLVTPLDLSMLYIGNYWRAENAQQESKTYTSELYVDTTQARVEIGNTSTWDTNTHREIQIPHTTWNDDQIQFTVNQGTFTDGESAYLYVVDENGVVNTTGYPITFGGIASNIPPVLASIGNKSLHEQETLTINVLASDDDPEDTLTLSASNLPTGATFTDNDGGSGAFSWTPTDQQANIYSNIHFEVTDGTDTDTEDITITVLDGAADCTPAWDCSNWSVCADSIQTRSCHDDNNCGSDAGRPVESAECDSTAPGAAVDLVAS